MQTQSARLVGGFALLAVVWIVTYWAWGPTEPKISFAMAPEELPEDLAKTGNSELNTSNANALKLGPPEPTTTGEEPVVIPPEFIGYVILPGDTLQSISAKHFRSTSYADAIAQANPLMDPTRLKLGRLIRIPRDPGNIQGIPSPAAPDTTPQTSIPNEYTVQNGDSLTSISKRFYGTTKYADLIFAENKSILTDRNVLKLGQVLRIPPKPIEGN